MASTWLTVTTPVPPTPAMNTAYPPGPGTGRSGSAMSAGGWVRAARAAPAAGASPGPVSAVRVLAVRVLAGRVRTSMNDGQSPSMQV